MPKNYLYNKNSIWFVLFLAIIITLIVGFSTNWFKKKNDKDNYTPNKKKNKNKNKNNKQIVSKEKYQTTTNFIPINWGTNIPPTIIEFDDRFEGVITQEPSIGNTGSKLKIASITFMYTPKLIRTNKTRWS